MICASPWNHLARMSVAAFLVTLATSAQAQEQKFKAVSVKTPDDLPTLRPTMKVTCIHRGIT